MAPGPKTSSEQSPKYYPKPNLATNGISQRSSRTFGKPSRQVNIEKYKTYQQLRKMQEAKVCPSPDGVFPNTYSINHKKEDCFNFKAGVSDNE